MAPVKTERYQNNGALSSPVHAYSCAGSALSWGSCHGPAFHHAVTEGQAMWPKLNFLLLAFRTLVLYLRQSVRIEESRKRMSFWDLKKFFPCNVLTCMCVHVFLYAFICMGSGEGGENDLKK